MQASNSAHQFKKKPSLSYATTRMSESMRLLVLGVAISPTRELSSQIYHVAQLFAAISIN
ncbi:hypothetical protein Leryth_000676 [Lithospermum erythrorhizon]|nr:hypothetical protein Leryth_000676 [Lithospermum erythrorhizon]